MRLRTHLALGLGLVALLAAPTAVLAQARPVAVPAVRIFGQVPLVSSIILIGIIVATCSSALAYFLSAPATAQALARDDVLPGFLSFLGRDIVRGGREPRWATILTLFIVMPSYKIF